MIQGERFAGQATQADKPQGGDGKKIRAHMSEIQVDPSNVVSWFARGHANDDAPFHYLCASTIQYQSNQSLQYSESLVLAFREVNVTLPKRDRAA